MVRDYRVISGDSHLQLAAERWTPHIPAKYRDQAPRTVRLPDGTDTTVINDKSFRFHGGLIGPYESRSPIGGQFEGSPGAGSPEQRLEEQDVDGIDGEILYTYVQGPAFYAGIDDLAAYKATIRAWNEFLAEEYCAVAPERLMGMGLLPDTSVEDAIAEMEYCARAGLKGVYLSKYPSGGEYPSPEDDLFWAAALDLDMPLTGHVQFASKTPVRTSYRYDYDLNEVAGGVDPFSKFTQYAVRGAGNALQMIFTGVFDRFPKLRFYFAETQVGWIPHFLDTLDDQYARAIPWAERLTGMKRLSRKPSEYVSEHFSWGFMHNISGVRVRDQIGVGNMFWATDFPHAETDWPESQHVIEEIFTGVPEDELRRMIGGNVIDYFHLTTEVQSAAAKTAADAS